MSRKVFPAGASGVIDRRLTPPALASSPAALQAGGEPRR